MTVFRVYLAAVWVAILGYTALVVINHGPNLLPIFFGDMMQMAWPGQFNFDFMFMLSLSAIWVAWRHHFSISGLALGFLAGVGGMAFLAMYLLVVSYQVKGDFCMILTGTRRD